MSKDLRFFLEIANSAGQLVRLTRPVDPDTEAGALVQQLERRGKVGVMESIKGRDGKLVGNLLGDRELLARAMGSTAADLVREFQHRLTQRVRPQRITGNAPSQEVVHTGDD